MIDQLLRSRSQRIIAGGRLAISLFALGAVWLDPSQPAQLPQVTYTLLVLYVAVATALYYGHRLTALSSVRLRLPAQALDLVIHVLELGLFAFLLYATQGLTSPFFPLFTFSIVSATFRWGWRAALWASAAVLVLLIVATILQLKLVPLSQIEIDRLLIRCAHVAVIGGMLSYFSFHQQRAEGEVLRLSRWIPEPASLVQLDEYLSNCARCAAEVFATTQIVVVAQDRDEPWASCVTYENGLVRQERLPSADNDLLSADTSDYFLLGNCADREILLVSQGGAVQSMPPPESFRELCEHVSASHLLSVPLQTDRFVGRLLVLNRPDFSLDEVIVANLAARQIESGLGRLGEIEALRRAATSEERLRMARDLHDGALQTLSAAAMHLEVIRRSPSDDRLKIEALQEWLHKEQRELRYVIERLRNDDTAEAFETDAGESFSLAEMIESIEGRWGIPITLSCSPNGLNLSADMGFQLQQIIREAAANAVRHGGATQLDVTLQAKDGMLDIMIIDNGKGLCRQGSFDARQCSVLAIGPRNLRERVDALKGNFRLISRPLGLQIDISLPLRVH